MAETVITSEVPEDERPTRLGPSYLITVWHDASDNEMKEIRDLFVEAYPVETMGHFVVTRSGVAAHCLDDADVPDEDKLILKVLTTEDVEKLKEKVKDTDSPS